MTASGARVRSLPAEAWVVALATLPGCGQHRLRSLLDAVGRDPEAAWSAVLRGESAVELAAAIGPGGAKAVTAWHAAAPRVDVERTWRSITDDGVGVWIEHGDGYPAALAGDPDPPPILFWRGDPQALEHPAVAIVGTRRCTAYGTDVARTLGRDLAASGVAVVSGLALGIDGAAHEGALAAGHIDGRLLDDDDAVDATPTLDLLPTVTPDLGPPVAVVGSGLDVVYPPRHRALWRRVADHGLLLTEAPPGAAPESWRFPRRNRILAALAKVVVVVESHAAGGSLSTVRHAIDRGITVMAVPGSVRSPASAGTNRLLADGVAPVTCADDVLTALSLEGALFPPTPTSPTTTTSTPTRFDNGNDDDESPVLQAVDWTPTATEDVLRRTGLTLGAAATELTRLEVQGRVRRRGSWWERR
jgi:DNA processing protein